MSVQFRSLEDQLALYKKLMISLTTEKPGVTEDIKKARQEKIYKIAKGLFTIEEQDEQFKKRIDSFLEDIASVKPGRKLIKALAAKANLPLKILKGEKNQYDNFQNAISVKDGERSPYRSIVDLGAILGLGFSEVQQQIIAAPAWTAFAHEMVHALQIPKIREQNIDTVDILPDMDNLYEQQAITGYNPCLFAKSNNVSYEDIICENAFLMAIEMPPRIDHRGIEGSSRVSVYDYDFYYNWLELTLRNKKPLPENDILEILATHPSAAPTISSELKNNPDFMLKLCKKNHAAFFEVDSGLIKSRDFVLKGLSSIRQGDPKYIDFILSRDVYLAKLDSALQKDPEILTAFGYKVTSSQTDTDKDDLRQKFEKSMEDKNLHAFISLLANPLLTISEKEVANFMEHHRYELGRLISKKTDGSKGEEGMWLYEPCTYEGNTKYVVKGYGTMGYLAEEVILYKLHEDPINPNSPVIGHCRVTKNEVVIKKKNFTLKDLFDAFEKNQSQKIHDLFKINIKIDEKYLGKGFEYLLLHHAICNSLHNCDKKGRVLLTDYSEDSKNAKLYKNVGNGLVKDFECEIDNNKKEFSYFSIG